MCTRAGYASFIFNASASSFHIFFSLTQHLGVFLKLFFIMSYGAVPRLASIIDQSVKRYKSRQFCLISLYVYCIWQICQQDNIKRNNLTSTCSVQNIPRVLSESASDRLLVSSAQVTRSENTPGRRDKSTSVVEPFHFEPAPGSQDTGSSYSSSSVPVAHHTILL